MYCAECGEPATHEFYDSAAWQWVALCRHCGNGYDEEEDDDFDS